MAGLRGIAISLVEAIAAGRSRPFDASDLARPALVFAPHQDDETLGCGGLIALKRRAGVPVSVVFLTDGATSHATRMPADELVARRRGEAVAACAVLGVAAADVHFLDLPDGELTGRLAAAADAAGGVLDVHPDHGQVFVPYAGDTTPDHIAARAAVLAALGERPERAWTVFEYPVWFWHHWPWARPDLARRLQWPAAVARGLGAAWRCCRDLTTVLDVGEVVALKRAALDCHATQMRRPDGDPGWPVLADVSGGEWLARFLDGREVFRRSTSGGRR